MKGRIAYMMFRARFRWPIQPLKRFTQPQSPSRTFIRGESTQSSASSHIDRITSRLPRSLQKYTTGLRNAPVSHIVSFLILHELTAIVPLFALVGFFHYTDFVPISWMTEHFGDYVQKGVARFERYFARKEWFGFSKEDLDDQTLSPEDRSGSKEQTDEFVKGFQSGDQKSRILVEVALAYAITKVLLPIRIIASVSATPWFAREMGRVRRGLTRKHR